MKSFIQFMGITATLTIMVMGISYAVMRYLVEFAPHWLTENGERPAIHITPKKTRIIPRRGKQTIAMRVPNMPIVKVCEGGELKRPLRYSQPQEMVHP
jgi:hypothetical protein